MALCQIDFPSAALGKTTRMHVILPDHGGGPFPTLYLLHGNEGDSQSYILETRLLSFAHRHPLVIVLPDGQRSRYVNSAACGRFEDYITQDVRGFVEKTFPVRRERTARAIGGYSMGGFGSMMLALKYPELYAALSAHSGSYYNGQWHDGGWMKAHPAREYLIPLLQSPGYDIRDLARSALAKGCCPAIRFDCGTEDHLIGVSRKCHAFFDEIGLPHIYEEFPGGHDHDYWNARLPEALAFVMRELSPASGPDGDASTDGTS